LFPAYFELPFFSHSSSLSFFFFCLLLSFLFSLFRHTSCSFGSLVSPSIGLYHSIYPFFLFNFLFPFFMVEGPAFRTEKSK
jgi:hypothetical protein